MRWPLARWSLMRTPHLMRDDAHGLALVLAASAASSIEKETQEFTAEFAENAEKKTLSNLCMLSDLCGWFVLKSIKRSVINIQRSMLDVRCSTFNLFKALAMWFIQ